MKTVLISLTLLIGLTSCTKDDADENQSNCNCTKAYYEIKYVNYVQKAVLIKAEKTCEPSGRKQTGDFTYTIVSCD